jgi:CubicO group peptidase (beta-lactamase class C family)
LSYGFDPTGTINPLDRLYHAEKIYSSGERPAAVPDVPLSDFADAVASRVPLQHQPGAHWNYSVATDIVGRIVEVVSGMSLPEFLRTRIFAPLGMDDTFFEIPPEKMSRLVPNFCPASTSKPDPTARGLRDISTHTTSRYLPKAGPRFHSGGGGLLSTQHDYLLFCEALRGRGRVQILSPQTMGLMAQNHLPNNSDLRSSLLPNSSQYSEITEHGVGFGLGFSVTLRDGKHITSPGTLAWGGAASTTFWIDPVLDITVVFMTQLQYADRAALPIRPILQQMVYASVPWDDAARHHPRAHL